MEVRKLVSALKMFDGGKIVVCGDVSRWSNIDYVTLDGSNVKIVMSDNLCRRADRASEQGKSQTTDTTAKG